MTTRKPTTVHRTTSHHSTNITTHDNLTTSGGPSHCDPLPHLGTKSDTLSIPLTSSATSDPEGVDITELDAHKLERVANYTLQKHNCLRTRVSPTAGNMLKMEWNQEAADQAQNWADQCSYNHNNETNRTTSRNTTRNYRSKQILNTPSPVNEISFGRLTLKALLKLTNRALQRFTKQFEDWGDFE